MALPRGKRKVKGKQQPLNWAVPRKFAPDIDIFEGIQELYDRLAQQDPVTYLIPDLDVGSFQEVTADIKWLPRAMPAFREDGKDVERCRLPIQHLHAMG